MSNVYSRLLWVMASLLLAACASSQPVQSPDPLTRPNVVLFIVDDLGWRDVGFMGADFYETPHIDRLAERGMVFTNAYSASPVCSPSRVAIMTGRDPVRYQITDWIPGFLASDETLLGTPEIAQELPLEARTIAEYFHQAGYATGFSGKWHLGGESRY